MLDPAPLGVLAARLMELLEAEHGDQDVELRAAMVLVDVGLPDPDDPEETSTVTRWQFASASDRWNPKRSSAAYAAGLCAQALAGLTEGDDI